MAAMKSFSESKGLKLHGVHHEIYLSDPRRVVPAKLKTILRHPVERITVSSKAKGNRVPVWAVGNRAAVPGGG
jgi:hypothetical protein